MLCLPKYDLSLIICLSENRAEKFVANLPYPKHFLYNTSNLYFHLMSYNTLLKDIPYLIVILLLQSTMYTHA